jgi:ribosomal protein S8
MVQNSLASLVAVTKLSLARGRLTAKVPYSKLNFSVLKILYFEGYIRGFRVTASTREIYIFYKLSNFRYTIADIAYFRSRNLNNYLSYKRLISFYGLKTFGIVSTNEGLMTIYQCFLHKKGGILLLLVK